MRAYKRAIDLDLSPRADLYSVGSLLERAMFSNGSALTPPTPLSQKQERGEFGQPEVLIPKEENPRVKQLAGRSRSGIGENGELLPKGRCIAVRDALFEAILDRFYEDPTLIAYGEENRDWGGAFAVYRGLTEALPYHRLFNSPISEGAIAGTSVGYALEGGRALVELIY